MTGTNIERGAGSSMPWTGYKARASREEMEPVSSPRSWDGGVHLQDSTDDRASRQPNPLGNVPRMPEICSIKRHAGCPEQETYDLILRSCLPRIEAIPGTATLRLLHCSYRDLKRRTNSAKI